ncbi:MAG: DUF1646 family protein [Nitrospiraceae bacterium]|nr:DUF1646 family protein [Nitrospiraceae bacterium]
MLTIILGIVFIIIIALPFAAKKVEENLEFFLLAMAVFAVSASHFFGRQAVWTPALIESSLLEPVKLTLATFVFGIVFRALRETMTRKIISWEAMLGPRLFAALVIFSLGILSSVITAIIASLVLCEIISALNFDKKYETIFTVLACFSIGMGAALTPLGEPLSTIAMAKLRGAVYPVKTLFLLQLLGRYIIPGIAVVAAFGAFLRGKEVARSESLSEDYPETVKTILFRAWKVYVFVVALVLLGTGFKPIIDAYVAPLPAGLLYWLNISSAVLDNATLAAAELSAGMSATQVKGILMGVIIAGGMLIPGNIPNIVASSKLRISSRTWAVIGVPVGAVLMAAYYVLLFVA